METYLGEFFWCGFVFWVFFLIALNNLASIGMRQSCGDAASAVLQHKQGAGILEGSPRHPLPLGAPLVTWLSIHCRPRRAAGLGHSVHQLRRSEAARREPLP